MSNRTLGKEKVKIGRPQKPFDFAVFEGLCQLQATLTEIAETLSVSEDTVERRCKEHYGATFAEVFRQKRSGGLVSLRRTQFKMAETNPTMAIWLGKQYLKQSDKVDVKVEDVDRAIETELERLSRGGEAGDAEASQAEVVH